MDKVIVLGWQTRAAPHNREPAHDLVRNGGDLAGLLEREREAD
jgi:hypothetical protein